MATLARLVKHLSGDMEEEELEDITLHDMLCYDMILCIYIYIVYIYIYICICVYIYIYIYVYEALCDQADEDCDGLLSFDDFARVMQFDDAGGHLLQLSSAALLPF